jgi:hypothetical protein
MSDNDQFCQKCGFYKHAGLCPKPIKRELTRSVAALNLSNDPNRLLYEVAGYLETLRMDAGRHVSDGSEVSGYWQTTDWLLGLLQLSEHCGKISGLTPAQYLNPPNPMKTTVIYHRADFDGIFCREIAKKFHPDAEFIGWDHGDAKLVFPSEGRVYVLDLSPDCFLFVPNLPELNQQLVWIDHHKSSIDKWAPEINGYRIDGVAACRLAWQWFAGFAGLGPDSYPPLPSKQDYVDRLVEEPVAVRLAGEYDIWDKRDPDAELFQHGLRSQELSDLDWFQLLGFDSPVIVSKLLTQGRSIQYAQTRSNESIIKEIGFTFQWEGLTFIACNHARYNSHLFTAGLTPDHDACFGFKWTGKEWSVSLYGVPGKPDVDLAAIAVKYGGGGHKQACGFRTSKLPFATGRLEDSARRMYGAYCIAVGGKAFNGDPLPSWVVFRADPNKKLQSDAWLSAASHA